MTLPKEVMTRLVRDANREVSTIADDDTAAEVFASILKVGIREAGRAERYRAALDEIANHTESQPKRMAFRTRAGNFVPFNEFAADALKDPATKVSSN